MEKALTPRQIEEILTVTDALGISREALVIPLRTETPGCARRRRDGKLEIVADRDADFEAWLKRLTGELRALTPG